MNLWQRAVKTAILLMAHGSREATANADLEHLAEALRQSGCCDHVVASYLELAEPGIVEGGRMCVAADALRVVMVPYFLSAGTHVRRDLVQARDQLAAAFPQVDFILAEPLGRHPLLAKVVMERFHEALDASSKRR
jgi:sirohydrochlorin ferrochelatase